MRKAFDMILKNHIYSKFIRSRAAPELIWHQIAKELIMGESLLKCFAYGKNCCSITIMALLPNGHAYILPAFLEKERRCH